MIDEKAKEILKKAFRSLRTEGIENLRFHLKNETPVLAGNWRGMNRTFGGLPYIVDGAG